MVRGISPGISKLIENPGPHQEAVRNERKNTTFEGRVWQVMRKVDIAKEAETATLYQLALDLSKRLGIEKIGRMDEEELQSELPDYADAAAVKARCILIAKNLKKNN